MLPGFRDDINSLDPSLNGSLPKSLVRRNDPKDNAKTHVVNGTLLGRLDA